MLRHLWLKSACMLSLTVGLTVLSPAFAAPPQNGDDGNANQPEAATTADKKQLDASPPITKDGKTGNARAGSKPVANSVANMQGKQTASVANQIPGVSVSASDMATPEKVQIKGFHPIKKLLQPIENLEGASIKIEQQVMKLEGPIAALHPPMNSLGNKMGSVNGTMGKMQNQVTGVDAQMRGVRSDLSKMNGDIAELKKPILAIQRPLADVEGPLARVRKQLNIILVAILLLTVGVIFGTPIAGVYVYQHRSKFFPKNKPA